MAAGSHAGSDYGSDIEEDEDLSELLHDVEFQHASQQRLRFLEQNAEASVVPTLAAMPSVLVDHDMDEYGWRDGEVEVLEDDAGILISPMEVGDQKDEDRLMDHQYEHAFGLPAVKESPDDTRSPLERFRSRKPLSVSDLVAPAWCELQYWYSLTKYGRKKRTPAMKEGSAVHKKLEEETLGVAVPVEMETREDGFALRLWNIIQSLRLLRATGMTRELEIWGIVDGQLINGVIDELSFTCADPAFEESLDSQSASPKKRGRPRKTPPPDTSQPSISQFLTSGSQSRLNTIGSQPDTNRKLYLTDLKTRTSSTLPSPSSLRPTKMQLMLYRHLLASLASNTLDASLVFERYGLDPSAELSKIFIESLGNIDTNLGPDPATNPYAESACSNYSILELLDHRTLPLLWQLMMQEYALTLPSGSANISRVLSAKFVSQRDQKVLGERTFAYDEAELKRYVKDEMAWWKGERSAKGVEIEEAFKCGICEFAGGCEWRMGKVDEAIKRSRERRTLPGTGKAAAAAAAG